MRQDTQGVNRPVLIYDGDCGYCKRSVQRWQMITQGRVDYAPSQEAADQYPQVPREQFGRSVVLIQPDGSFCVGAEAVFRSLAVVPHRGWAWWMYRRVPGVAPVSEAAYRFVASHRNLMAWITQTLWGPQIGPPSHLLTRWVFLRLLGVVYLIAFLSLGVQVVGLIGAHGITPAADYVARARDALGTTAWQKVPTIFLWHCSDAWLRGACWAGAACAVLLIFRIAPMLMLAVMWVLYLSLTVVGSVFLNFQWDVLLLEVGLLAIFFAPLRLLPRLEREPPPSRIALWLLRWLLFRLIFLSGVVKLTSGDNTWFDLTALDYHYLTQPLPTWVAWYAYHLPAWFQHLSVVVMFVIELGLPFLIFMPRRVRFVAAGGIMLLMVLIGLTGNYNFFNLITIALCITLLDDTFLRRFFRRRTRARVERPRAVPLAWPRRAVLGVLATFIVFVSVVNGIRGTWQSVTIPAWATAPGACIAPWRCINAYGLFRVMTTRRAEIIVEGSNDGQEWRAYEFRWKPGDPLRRPAFVEPHQPRLDWQMWFAALGDYRSPSNRWFLLFLERLMDGEPDVLALLANNPFPENPPRFLRARLFDYRFTDAETRRKTGAWWTRTELGPYTPVLRRR
ncbi:MAG TPA: lipase maturation factor family protein [Phycisphaerae bacterium]|nr:lipase maturation factor family protein [Phycisphaerales bacterium]HRX86168.1 lipase maturation factor family protein [Phycisphaerae bacterium]